MAKCVFAIAAHPDDIEFLMAGTLILLGQRGFDLHYMTIANGCCGTTHQSKNEIIRIRRLEAIEAAKSIGAVFHESLVDDIDIFYEKNLLSQVAAVIREVSPEILLVHSLDDYMEDHHNAARLAVTAAFCRGMINYKTSPNRDPIENEVVVYHAQPHGNRDFLRQVVRPELYVDITSIIEKKCEMLECHKSQKDWLDKTQGMDSLINEMKKMNREMGEMSGRFQYAEGWRRRLHLGFAPENSDPLAETLSEYIFRHS